MLTRRTLLASAAGLSLAGCTPVLSQTGGAVEQLPRFGPAPELQSDVWLNSEPIPLATIRGTSSALLVFWTYT